MRLIVGRKTVAASETAVAVRWLLSIRKVCVHLVSAPRSGAGNAEGHGRLVLPGRRPTFERISTRGRDVIKDGCRSMASPTELARRALRQVPVAGGRPRNAAARASAPQRCSVANLPGFASI